ncbi:MAG: hypothetical protein L3J24_13850 [Xanthomonadales bacterium]|nr:hypothetical protein [Xanthomonadales bacterium]
MISAKRLAYMLIILIALQSVTVVAEDNHKEHQNGDQHQVLDKDHEHQEPSDVDIDAQIPITQGGDLDCHHCCHCHSPTQLEFLSNSNNFNYAKIFGLPSEYLFNYISKPFSPALRPPIV